MRVTMIGLCLLLFSALVWAGTLTDDFSDGNTDGWQKSDPWGMGASWQVENGKLVGISSNANGFDTHLYLKDSQSWKDYELSIRVKIVKNFSEQVSGGGLLMRQTANPKQYMHFKLVLRDTFLGPDSPKARFLMMNAGKWETTEELLDAKLGAWHQLRLKASGRHFEGYVDGNKVIDKNDNHFAQGAVGIALNGAEAHYDEFVVTGDDVPDLALSAQPSGKLATLWARLKRP